MSKTCSIEGCDKLNRARGLCITHWSRWYRHGDSSIIKRVLNGLYRACAIEGCDKKAHARGWCNLHYALWRRHGSPHITKVTPNGLYTACMVTGCTRPYMAVGLCDTHYKNRVARPRRRALFSGAKVNDFTWRQWQKILSAYQYRCAYCGGQVKGLTQDHITPLSKGGNHTASNIVPACRSCNSKKSNSIGQYVPSVKAGV